MLQSLIWGYSCVWVPIQAFGYKVVEVWILVSDHVVEGFPVRFAELASRVLQHYRVKGLVDLVYLEELHLSLGDFEHLRRWHIPHLHDSRHLIVFTLSRKERVANIQFSHDAPKRPHVNRRAVRNAKHNFRRPIEPRLDISIHFLIDKSRTSEIYYFDAGLVFLLEENVLRLQITMDYLKLLQVLQSVQQLDCEPSDEVVVETIEVIDFEELEQVHGEKFKCHAEMLPENNIVFNMNHVHDILLVMLP